ncbi:MAG TPA: HAMP domain-containing sensor histidine kinase, partial [Candidatus Synoicihabitans sp.]|nr:HAMP domain-containing sensor histidine kinase [Candidatus Synoicihabitans sp.]
GGTVRWGGDPVRQWAVEQPWRQPFSAPTAVAPEIAASSAAANVEQYNRARQEIQQLAKVKEPATPRAPAAGALADREADVATSLMPHQAWTVWRQGHRVHVFAWRETSSGGLVGLELNVDEVLRRAAEVIPPATPAEAYHLQQQGADLQAPAGGYVSVSKFSRETGPAVRVPVFSEILPDWEIAAYAILPTAESPGALGFFGLGGVLVAVLVATIAIGGALLVRDARRSQLEAAQKTTFVANVSHELKTPLTTIRLYAELLEQDRVKDAELRRAFLATIGLETNRLGRLVNNVLDFSRLEQGRKEFDLVTIDLVEELARWLDGHEPRLADAGLRLVRQLPAEPVPTRADRDALHQILLNLLDNGVKYGASGAELAVELRALSGSGAEISVADRGPGIPVAEQERVFARFHRLDNSLTAPHSGAGLGLSIARALARGMGGDLRCQARPGGGAVFILSLP